MLMGGENGVWHRLCHISERGTVLPDENVLARDAEPCVGGETTGMRWAGSRRGACRVSIVVSMLPVRPDGLMIPTNGGNPTANSADVFHMMCDDVGR